ncbi:hypothetical protein ACWGIR_22840 [Streptomyces albidoflavus]
MQYQRPPSVSLDTAVAVLDLYAEVYADRHDFTPPTGLRALRQGRGPALMVPTPPTGAARTDDKVTVSDVTGNHRPAIVFQAADQTDHYCDCCSLSGCWTRDVARVAERRGIDVYLEPANYDIVSILQRP